MDTFIPAYFQSLSGALDELVSPDVMLPALMSGTRRMMANDVPAQTLRNVFDTNFFPKLGVENERLRKAIDKFYDDIFLTAP